MKKCMVFVLLMLFFLSACTDKTQSPLQEDSKPTESTQLQESTQPNTPADSTTEPTAPVDTDSVGDHWYNKIDVSDGFDKWQVRVAEWNEVFYFVAEDGLYSWDPKTESEDLLIGEDIRGLFVYNDHFYCYTEFEIFELIFGDENTAISVWEHPGHDTDESSMGICGLMVHDDWFYIKTSGTTVIRYNTEGRQEEFPSDFSSLVLLDDVCYYIDHANKSFTIYRLDEETKESEIIRGDGISKGYGDSSDLCYDELRVINGELYYYVRETNQFYRYAEDGNDEQFRENAWIIDSYLYPNMCYGVVDGDYVRVYEEDALGDAYLILSMPSSEVTAKSPFDFVLVTETAVFFKTAGDSQLQFDWKYIGKEG